MYNLIKINKEEYPEIFSQNIEKYMYLNEEKNIIGIATIDDKLQYNKIKINILEEYRGNGYGNELFRLILKEYKENYKEEKLIFKIDVKETFNNILYKAGAIKVGNDNGLIEFVLPLKLW